MAKSELLSPTMQFKKGLGVELLRIQSICLLPNFPQLINATLSGKIFFFKTD